MDIAGIWSALVAKVKTAVDCLLEPPGYTLLKEGGDRKNRIRGDLIPRGVLVIEHAGMKFVRTGKRDDAGFEIYQEGASTFKYGGDS